MSDATDAEVVASMIASDLSDHGVAASLVVRRGLADRIVSRCAFLAAARQAGEPSVEDGLLNDLRYYGTTLNECPDIRSLLRRAAGELERLSALASPIKCHGCKAEIKRADAWYRCFDCKVHLCEHCLASHMGHDKTARPNAQADDEDAAAAGNAIVPQVAAEFIKAADMSTNTAAIETTK